MCPFILIILINMLISKCFTSQETLHSEIKVLLLSYLSIILINLLF